MIKLVDRAKARHFYVLKSPSPSKHLITAPKLIKNT